jgi:protoporphyrinogen oxidase
MARTAIIIGAGPAGLTAAHELLARSDIRPIVLEASRDIGGLSKTVEYKGNRLDIGGHRFFSKSDRVMEWWRSVMPIEGVAAAGDGRIAITYRNRTRTVTLGGAAIDPATSDLVMLVRRRLSRIFFLRRFFDYPIALNLNTARNLGLRRLVWILASYARARLAPIEPERSLEDFFVNRFGRELYLTFFKDYTEKVWGVPCDRIKPEWGIQRVKGLSITRAVLHALRSLAPRGSSLAQKGTETSLVERFLYPKFGPGQLWEEVARRVRESGGEIVLGARCVELQMAGSRVAAVEAIVDRGSAGPERRRYVGDFVFSTMPIKDLVAAMGDAPPPHVREVASGLVYRDFITVGLLLRRLAVRGPEGGLIADNWIYIQEPDVRVGRLQVFNNWSPYLVKDPGTVWLGLEYFCDQGDDLWRMADAEMIALATEELARIGIIDAADVLDATVLRMEKTYPAYFGAYERFDELRAWLDPIENLYLIGRNGMHRYNNADHSMLTAMTAVDNIVAGVVDKAGIWAVNTEQEYYEDAATLGKTAARPLSDAQARS